MGPVTLKDVAALAKVSTATVSLVLNNKGSRISKEKQAEIRKIADQLNYKPNLYARALVTNTTNTIGLIIPDIENPFFASLSKTIEGKLREFGYSLMLINTDDKFTNDLESIEVLNNKGVDGLILILSVESYLNKEKIFEVLNGLDKPFVLADRIFKEASYNQVSFDSHHGQYLATKHLIDRGYQRIAFIAPPKDSFHSNEKIKGYQDAIEGSNLVFDPSLIQNGNYRFSSGYELTSNLLSKNIDAILVSNDIVAYGAIKNISENDYKIPKDIAVVGYDDLIYSNMSLVSLTTVRQDYSILSNNVVDLLMNNIQGDKNRKTIILAPELIVRNSTKKLNS